jgi:anti-sigma regulatory factor (Ser/Thr protein kinase)
VTPGSVHQAREFAHEALLYAGEDEFVAGTAAFIREGVEAGEPVLVVVAAGKIDRLREELDGHAGRVLFADMAEVGANPARIIPAWEEFVEEHLRDDRPVRGIGEPISVDRTAVELVECQRHESLLNLAFADAPAWRLLCPYDTSALDDAVIDEALRSHPIVVRGGERTASDRYRGLAEIVRPFDAPLPDPPPTAEELPFDGDLLADGRHLVARRAASAGLPAPSTNDLVVAVNEILTNSVRHGGGAGVLRIWQADGTLICEVEDRGRIQDPLVDRRRPDPQHRGGRGLWMANQLCDLVQVRSPETGNVVRLHMRCAAA